MTNSILSHTEIKTLLKGFYTPGKISKFISYHEENPEVFYLFLKFASQAKRVTSRYGAKSIGEQIRWHFNIEKRTDDFKMNNTFTAYYARLLIMRYPRKFKGFFELRRSPVRKGI